jgi:hypothetical protein
MLGVSFAGLQARSRQRRGFARTVGEHASSEASIKATSMSVGGDNDSDGRQDQGGEQAEHGYGGNRAVDALGQVLGHAKSSEGWGCSGDLMGEDGQEGREHQWGEEAEHGEGGNRAIDALAESGHLEISERFCALREEAGLSGLQGDPCGPSMAIIDTPTSFFDQITYR